MQIYEYYSLNSAEWTNENKAQLVLITWRFFKYSDQVAESFVRRSDGIYNRLIKEPIKRASLAGLPTLHFKLYALSCEKFQIRSSKLELQVLHQRTAEEPPI